MLTPLGWGIAAASVVFYAVGAWLGYSEPLVFALAGVLAVIAAALYVVPQPKLTVRREITPLRVARGEPATGVLHVGTVGRGRRGLRARDVCGDTAVDIEVPRLRSGRTESVSYPLPTSRRGEIPIGPLRLVRADPLGLARRTRDYGEVQTLLVRPRTVALPSLPSGRAHHLEGPTTDRAPAGTVTFHALREYVVGDDLRHIHWRSSARTGTLMVRQLVDASLPQTTVVIDTDRGSYSHDEAFELAVDAAASVAVGAAMLNFPVRMLSGAGALLETRGGPHDVETILDRLARLNGGRAEHSAFDIVRRVRSGGALVMVTGGAGDLTRAASLRRRFDRVVCVRALPAAPAPAMPGVQILDMNDLTELRARWGRAR
jgi:uncharacterized protein (DUF58 family)